MEPILPSEPKKSDEHHIILRAEYGAWERVLYWGFDVCFERKTLTLFEGPDKPVPRVVSLSDEQTLAFFNDAEKFKLWDLPSTNYDADMTDDLYHMGVSIDARSLKSSRFFYHKVPDDVFVMVATRKVTKVQFVSFSAFVQMVVRRAVEISGSVVPEHLANRWKSKSILETLQ